MGDDARARRSFVAAVVLVPFAGVALAVWGTWPLAKCLDRCVVDPWGQAQGRGLWWISAALRRDVDLVAWILAWGAHVLGTHPAALFDAPIFHPAPNALATTEHLLGLQVLYLPLRLATGDPLAAHQATLIATFAAAFVTTACLVRAWTGSWLAGATAGVLYAFSPFRAGYVAALHMEAAWVLPLVVLAIERVGSGAGIGWTLGVAATLALQALSSYYLGYASGIAAGVLLAAAALDPRSRPHLGRLVAAIGAAFGVVAACSLPYLRARADGTLVPPDPAYVAIVSAAPGRTGATLAVALALVTVPWWRRAMAPGHGVRWLVAVACAGLAAHALALGPTIRIGDVAVPGPFALAEAIVPGLRLVRGPGRLNVVTTLAAAVLAGAGIAGLGRALSTRWAALGRLVPLVGLAVALASVPRTMGWPLSVETVGETPPVYAWLARDGTGPVVELPWHDLTAEPDGVAVEARRLRWSTAHWRPLANGYSGYAPPSYAPVSALARALPDPKALELLVRTTGVRRIVVHRRELDRATRRRWIAARAVVRPVARVGDAIVFAPRVDQAPDLAPALLAQAASATPLGTPRRPLADGARRATIAVTTPLRAIPWMNPMEIAVTVTNRGDATWPAMGARAAGLVTLGYRWIDACERVLATVDDAGRLPWDPAPGETVAARMVLRPPGTPGAVTLEVGAVQDGVWLDGTAVTRILRADPPGGCAAGANAGGVHVTS